LAKAGRDEWVVCQVTSKKHSDAAAVEIMTEDFATGALQFTSYARPNKLFTASESLMETKVGTLKPEAFARIWNAIVQLKPE